MKEFTRTQFASLQRSLIYNWKDLMQTHYKKGKLVIVNLFGKREISKADFCKWYTEISFS